MADKGKLLILTARFGNGHLSVAKAIQQLLKKQNSSITIEIKDLFEVAKPKTYEKIYKNYEFLIRHGSWLFNTYYYSKEKFDKIKLFDTASLAIQKRLQELIERSKPDVIISTFPVCSGYVSKYKRQSKSKIPLITVITDIVATNEWIYPHTDLYCVATQEVKKTLIKKNVTKEKIIVTGIPLRHSFYKNNHTDYHFDLLNQIPKSTKVITFLGGGLGLLPKEDEFYDWLSELDQTHCIIVTGKNEKLYNRLNQKLKSNHMTILGYTEFMDEIMKRSDLLIGKPGGITIFESIITNVPCVMLRPSLGQEIENCKYIKKHNIGFIVGDSNELKTVVKEILTNDNKLMACKSNIARVSQSIEIKQLVDKTFDFLSI